MLLLDTTLKLLARDKLSVLLFHAVPAESPTLVNDVTLATFERTIDFVGERFTVIPLSDAVECLQRGKLPPRAACITFDDGYDNWLDGPAAVLERRNMHATFFITTGQFDGDRMWHERLTQAIARLPDQEFDLPGLGVPRLPMGTVEERRRVLLLLEQLLKYQRLAVREELLAALERRAGVSPAALPRMTQSQLRQLHAKGFAIGAHTVAHPILSLCEPALAQREIGIGREMLQGIIGAPVTAFAYPNGRPMSDFGPEHVTMVQRAGYTHAVTTQWGAATVRTPVFEIPRFTPWGPSEARMGLQLTRNLVTRPRLTGLTRPLAAASPEAGAQTEPARRPVVAFVENGAGFGGAIVALQTLIEGLAQQGGTYHVVANMPVGQFGAMPGVRSFHVIRDRVVDFRAVAQSLRGRLGTGLLSKSLLFLIGRMDDVVNRLPYLLRLCLHLWRLQPDIVHGNNEPTSNREAMLAAKLLRLPYVQHVRGALGVSRNAPWMLAGPRVFVPVSRWLAGDLLACGVPGERVRQVYDAIELDEAPPPAPRPDLRRELGLAPDVVLVALVGMLVRWKGQDLFLEAIARMGPAQQKLAFLLIGGTPERGDPAYAQALQAKAAALAGTAQVHLLGRRDDVAELLPQIQVAVSASTEPEPLGLVMLEAIAHGCVFVGPAFGAAPEVIRDGHNGYLFTPGSPAALADKLEAALRSLALVDDASRREARAYVTEGFSGPRCAHDILDVHRSLLPHV
nr:glycosyltransferase [Variovorax boronicumulans]